MLCSKWYDLNYGCTSLAPLQLPPSAASISHHNPGYSPVHPQPSRPVPQLPKLSSSYSMDSLLSPDSRQYIAHATTAAPPFRFPVQGLSPMQQAFMLSQITSPNALYSGLFPPVAPAPTGGDGPHSPIGKQPGHSLSPAPTLGPTLPPSPPNNTSSVINRTG